MYNINYKNTSGNAKTTKKINIRGLLLFAPFVYNINYTRAVIRIKYYNVAYYTENQVTGLSLKKQYSASAGVYITQRCFIL